MQSNAFCKAGPLPGLCLPKILLYMRLTTFFLLVVSLQVQAKGHAQQKITLEGKNISLETLFQEIHEQSGFDFLYSTRILEHARPISIRVKNSPLEEVLKQCMKGQPFEYHIVDRTVIIKLTGKAEQQPSESSAPPVEITGTIKDSSGRPLVGVNVMVKHSNIGAKTDNNGAFHITVPDKRSVLIFSYLSFKTEERLVGNNSVFDIVLTPEYSGLNQVVVVGFGTKKKVDLTGAISTISGEEIENRQVGQTSMALQGIAPGVTITQGTGQPGVDGGTIRIRGVGTLNNPDPLVLVDGIEMSINSIDVSSVQSISVLKDAAAASIYGSRAANGVILVTTKRGGKGISVSYNSYLGVQRATNIPRKVNAVDHMTLLNEAYTNIGLSPVYTTDFINQYPANHITDPDNYPDEDWEKAILNGNGLQTNHFLSLSGGTDRFKFYGAFGFLSQNGLVKPVNYKRTFFRLNTDVEISKKLSGSFDVFIINSNRGSVSQYNSVSSNGSGIGLIWGMMNKLPAVQPIRNSSGTWAVGQNGENPVAILKDGGFYQETSTPIEGNFSLKYKPFDFLTAQVAYSPNFSQPQTKSFVNVINTYNPNGTIAFSLPGANYLNETVAKIQSDQAQATLNFSKDYGRHALSLLGGFQYVNYSNSGFGAFRDGFLFPEYTVLSAGSVSNMQNSGTATAWSLVSYFGRLNYNYDDKYLFEANIRYDGSSRFSEGHKWGTFPSFSAGWRISQENFMESVRGVINNLKIRASWGRLGNQNIGSDYPFASTVTLGTNYISNGVAQNGAAITTAANPDISWESTEMSNIGADITIQKNLSVSFDYYYKKTTGILLQLNIPQTMGLTAPYQNAGVVENKGWDLQVDYTNHVGKFRYGITATLSDVKNKVLDLKGIQQNGLIVNHEGYPINSLFLYHSQGLISEKDMNGSGNYAGPTQFGSVKPGDIKYQDYNNDGIINSNDQQVLGSTIPRYTYSVNLSLGYQNIDVSALFQGVARVDGYLSSNAIMPFFSGGTAFEEMKDRWTTANPNPDAKFPRLAFGQSNNTQNSSFWEKSAAYLRIKNLQVGYTLPASILNRFKIKKIRIYLSGENLFTLTKFWTGWDPEIPAGSNGFYYPQVKTYNAGLNVNF